MGERNQNCGESVLSNLTETIEHKISPNVNTEILQHYTQSAVHDNILHLKNEHEWKTKTSLKPIIPFHKENFDLKSHSNNKLSITHEMKPIADPDQSTVDKGKKIANQDDSMMMLAAESYNISEGKNKSKNLVMLNEEVNENNKKINSIPNIQEIHGSNASSSIKEVCRICYEGENAEKGILIKPCVCTGTCKFIHESCLKKWIENNITENPKYRSECEICKSEFTMKFFMKYRFSKVKFCSMMKSLSAIIIVASVVLTLIFTVIYVVVSSLSSMTDDNKRSLINILIGIAGGILVLVILYSLRNCKKSFCEQYLSEWKIYNMSQVSKSKSLENGSNIENQIIIHQAINGINSNSLQEGGDHNSDENNHGNIYANYPFIQNMNQVVVLS